MKIESIDAAIADIADEQSAAELAEMVRGANQAPGGLQGAMRNETPNQMLTGTEGIHEPLSHLWWCGWRERVGDQKQALNELDVIGGIPGWKVRISIGNA